MDIGRAPNDAVHDCGDRPNDYNEIRPRGRTTLPLHPRERAQMAKWIRFEENGKAGFGTLEGETIAVHTGDMFAGAKPSGQTLKLSDVQVSTPCQPSKMVCLWNNFHQLAAKNEFKQSQIGRA